MSRRVIGFSGSHVDRPLSGRWRGVLRALAALLLPAAVLAPTAGAQEAAATATQLGATRAAGTGAASMGEGGMAVLAPVDPETYVLGPLDGVVLAIWDQGGGHTATHALRVTLEERLLIPSVGEVDVSGLSLAQAEREIADLVRRRLGAVRVTLTLTDLRRIKVPVTGRVDAPGIYAVGALDRVSELLDRVGLSDGASRRLISIMRDGRERARVDLVRFRTSGDLSWNPVLRNGDAVQVPFARAHVWVHGAVNIDGQFELIEGDRVSDVLTFTGGFAPDAKRDTIEVSRVSGPVGPPMRVRLVATVGPDGRTIYVPAGAAAKAGAGDFVLDANDRIFVSRIGNWENRQLATIAGEVVNPGAYPIVEGETRLADLFRYAGGVTDDASLIEATLVRTSTRSLSDPEYERLSKIPISDMTEDEYEYVKMRARATPGQMVVDFRKLLVEHDPAQNILLMDGDEVHVPLRKDHVSVLGLVRRPGNVTYEPGLRYRDYVDLAGGFAERADKGSSRVVRVATGEWEKPGDVDTFRPGDTIWVPEKRDRDWWEFFRDGLLVATQIATLYLVADRAVN